MGSVWVRVPRGSKKTPHIARTLAIPPTIPALLRGAVHPSADQHPLVYVVVPVGTHAWVCRCVCSCLYLFLQSNLISKCLKSRYQKIGKCQLVDFQNIQNQGEKVDQNSHSIICIIIVVVDGFGFVFGELL